MFGTADVAGWERRRTKYLLTEEIKIEEVVEIGR